MVFYVLNLEEDKRATTNAQNGLVFFFYSLLVSLHLFEAKTAAPKSVNKCRDDFAL